MLHEAAGSSALYLGVGEATGVHRFLHLQASRVRRKEHPFGSAKGPLI
jgi:hypothetical protein